MRFFSASQVCDHYNALSYQPVRSLMDVVDTHDCSVASKPEMRHPSSAWWTQRYCVFWDEGFSVCYCRGDGRSRTIHVSFCSRDSSPALTMAALIRLSTSLIRTSDNEKKKNLHWAIQFPSSTWVKYIQQRTRIKDVCHVKIKRTWTSGRTVDIHPLLVTQQNHDRLMNSVSTNRWGW